MRTDGLADHRQRTAGKKPHELLGECLPRLFCEPNNLFGCLGQVHRFLGPNPLVVNDVLAFQIIPDDPLGLPLRCMRLEVALHDQKQEQTETRDAVADAQDELREQQPDQDPPRPLQIRQRPEVQCNSETDEEYDAELCRSHA